MSKLLDYDGLSHYDDKIKDLIATIRLGKGQDGYVYIFVAGEQQGYGFDPSTGDIIVPTVYGDVVPQQLSLSIAHSGTVTLSFKLSRQPSANQSVAVFSNTEYLTLSSQQVTFTEANWDTWQTVTITNTYNDIGSFNSSIVIRNSDQLMTETTIPIVVNGITYNDMVDTTIPSGAHTLTPEDFTNIYLINNNQTISLRGYKSAYTNVFVPATMTYEGSTRTVNLATEYAFQNNTTIEYVTIETGVASDDYGSYASSRSWVHLFLGCTNLIGVKYAGADITSLYGTFNNCSSLKFFDGLEKQSLCTNMYYAFSGASAIDYLPDLSGLTAVSDFNNAFAGCSSLKRIFGLPTTLTTTAVNAVAMYKNCTLLEYAEIPDGVNYLFYTFQNCTSLRRTDLYTTQTISSAAGIFEGCSNLYAYCIADSDLYDKLFSAYGSSTSIHIVVMGGSELPSVVVWGDSLSSPNVAWEEWPARLQTMLGNNTLAVKNEAVAGETTTSTSARQGGNAISVAAFTIPATTERVQVTATSSDNQTFGGNAFTGGGSFNPCKVADTPGYLSTSNGVVYFKRETAGTAVSVSANSTVTSMQDSILNNEDAVMIVLLGNNAGWNLTPSVLLNQAQMMVTHFLAKGGTKYIIAGPMSGQFMRTSGDIATVQQYEALAAEEFGSHWFNLRQYLITNGLTQNNLTASSTDTERIAAGQVPGSLLGGGTPSNIVMYPSTSSDDSHPNAYGANSMALGFYAKGQALGYWE